MTIKTSSVWFVYLLECLNGKIYTGITTNVEARFNKHLSGKGAKFTKMNPPSHIIATQQCENRSEAEIVNVVVASTVKTYATFLA